MVNAIYFCPGDPWNSPRGGQTAFAVQVLNAFGSRFAVVAPREDNSIPVGQWIMSHWQGRPIYLFNIGSFAPKKKSKLPLIPRRIIYRSKIKKYLSAIRTIGLLNLYCDSPELLGLLCKYDWDSVCYRFAGLNNPVEFSRYRQLRIFYKWFHLNMMKNLSSLSPNVLLASASTEEIKIFESQNESFLKGTQIHFFPTRFDPKIFFPNFLSLDKDHFPRLVMVGRLCWIKGWELVLRSISILRRRYRNLLLVFVGDGEDRALVERKINDLNLNNNVRITGFLKPNEVAEELRASHIYLSASVREGWSTTTTEALGCGKIIVSTNVSGVKDMIIEGENGYVINSRNPEDYVNAIENAIVLLQRFGCVNQTSLDISRKFSFDNFTQDWENLWNVL